MHYTIELDSATVILILSVRNNKLLLPGTFFPQSSFCMVYSYFTALGNMVFVSEEGQKNGCLPLCGDHAPGPMAPLSADLHDAA